MATTPLLMAGLSVLILGDSHMAHPHRLSEPLYETMTKEGASVYIEAACGNNASSYIEGGEPTNCSVEATPKQKPTFKLVPNGKPSESIQALLAKYHPNLVVIILGDAMGGYTNDDATFPRSWIWDQASTIAEQIKSGGASCIWVGPPYGQDKSIFPKTPHKVERLDALLKNVVTPCYYVTSLMMGKPGEFQTEDGAHFTAVNGRSPGYDHWSKYIMTVVNYGVANFIKW